MNCRYVEVSHRNVERWKRRRYTPMVLMIGSSGENPKPEFGSLITGT